MTIQLARTCTTMQKLRAIDNRIKIIDVSGPLEPVMLTHLLHIQCGERKTTLTGQHLIRHFWEEFNVERRVDLWTELSEIPFGAERPVQIGWKITIRTANWMENILCSPTIQFWRPSIYLATLRSISSPQEGTCWRSCLNRSKLPLHRSPTKSMASWRAIPMSCITTMTML